MNAEMLLQRVMRGWLTFHIVSTGTMFGLAAVHIFTALVLLDRPRTISCSNLFSWKASSAAKSSG